jgi:hypothetical protein
MTINRRQSLKALIRYVLLGISAGIGAVAWQQGKIDIYGTLACSLQECASCEQYKTCTRETRDSQSGKSNHKGG